MNDTFAQLSGLGSSLALLFALFPLWRRSVGAYISAFAWQSAVLAGVTALAGLPGQGLQGLNAQASDTNKFEGKGASTGSNVFTGTMTATVIEVLPNGNLLISGEKQVAIGQGQEFIRVSGVVNPYTVTAANTVNSSQMADARIEYKSTGYISEAQVMGWLARFFLTFLPF